MALCSAFLDYLSSKGFSLATGVPCSYFKDILNCLRGHKKICYVPATREDEAIGIAVGYSFGGGKSFLLMQNSGLANIGDALTSLAQLYKVPLLILVSYRGLIGDVNFPEHSLMGNITENVIEAYKLPCWTLSKGQWKSILDEAMEKMNNSSLPVCLLVKGGVFTNEG